MYRCSSARGAVVSSSIHCFFTTCGEKTRQLPEPLSATLPAETSLAGSGGLSVTISRWARM
ncbi:hypothetical protein E2C01_075363 [Portunus trituberculatus]|uniref:Uncharacterized protein n=1 Tax=Portunus trituberculatus TaxID=210409 RepID=A0A5B7I5W8_PORTR|nr:hypothetical protein [Portunus trituberculatus]